MVIDIRHGDVIDWVRLSDDIVELFDVAVIPMTRCPTGIRPDSPELQDAITFEEAPRDGPCLTQLRGFAGCRIAKRLIFLGLTLDGRHYKVACERRILWRNKIISREISRTPASHNRVGRHYSGFCPFRRASLIAHQALKAPRFSKSEPNLRSWVSFQCDQSRQARSVRRWAPAAEL